MKFLVTGGAGFIGSHLCDRLLLDGHRVAVLDNLSTGRLENLPQSVEFIQGEVTNPGLVYELLNAVDGCFHLAAIPSVVLSHQDWLKSTRVNLLGSVTIFEAARRAKIPIVYASSAAVYGDSPAFPLKETSKLSPLSAYGVDKLSTELHANIATFIHGVPTVGLRFFNVFGPRQDPLSPYSGVISIFMERLKNNCPISIFGDGEQVRDFIFVEDVVTALVKAFDFGLPSKIYNICTGQKISINALAKEMASLLNAPLEINYLPPRNGDIQVSIGDPKKAAQEMGFKSRFSLKAGLSKMLSAGAVNVS